MTYPAGDVSLDLVGKGVGEQEEAVDPQAQHQERHNLGRAGVEGDPDQGSQSHAWNKGYSSSLKLRVGSATSLQ